jgi:FkbM family methyltransferase
MISYAQNAEDVVLARIFKARRPGFYIDIGAGHPVFDSVTKYFYDNGWHGVNVEPVKEFVAELRSARPRDVNLNAGVMDVEGQSTLYQAPDHMLGQSTLSKDHALAYRHSGVQLREEPVEIVTLAAICDKYAPTAFEFLKVDVEGLEREVLVSGDWTRWRPRVVVVEAIDVLTHMDISDRWEDVLKSSGYQCALFDGINRFYTTHDDGEVVELLRAPANVLDGYVPYAWARKEAELRDRIRGLEATEREASVLLRRLRRQLQGARAGQARMTREGGEVRAQLQDATRRANDLEGKLGETHGSLRATEAELRTARIALSDARVLLREAKGQLSKQGRLSEPGATPASSD